ncbi:MAG: histidine--tRNA ligase [Candidatus Syntropharchaeia archaeon]
MTEIKRPRGTRDFLPDEMRRRKKAENELRKLAERWGYEEIKTPTFENLELFTLKSGEEIINEIYEFEDKGGRKIALRPELTAPVLRMYVNELRMKAKPIKLYYFDNCFRYERPQKGRFREFWQFGVEVIGSDLPEAEAEVIALSCHMLKALNVEGNLHIGHIGMVRDVLRELDEEEKRVVLRLMDKKDIEGLKIFLSKKRDLLEVLLDIIMSKDEETLEKLENRESVGRFEKTLEILDIYGVEYTIDFSIVRGLDYYTGTVFEIYAKGLGAQDQICGGGSYRLAHLFGGDDVPSTGFALGFDRILEIYNPNETPQMKVAVVSTEGMRKEAIRIALKLREHFPTYVDLMGRGMGAQFSYADAWGAGYVVIVGEREMREGKITLRDMKTGEQRLMKIEEIIRELSHENNNTQ